MLSQFLNPDYLLTTGCEREKAYQINSNIRRIIATTPVTARHQSFSNITKPAEMWEWLERDLTEIIFTNHSQNLGSSVIIGNATKFEQVRQQIQIHQIIGLIEYYNEIEEKFIVI